MKIYANDGDSINIGIWAYGEGEFKPLQTGNSLEEFNVSIDDEKIAVYYNKPKTGVNYYYLHFNGLWHWTRDDIRNHSRYTT